MVAWFLVISFWAPDGELSRHTSTLAPTQAICEAHLKEYMTQFKPGTANAACLPTPVRSPDLPPFIPGLKKQDT